MKSNLEKKSQAPALRERRRRMARQLLVLFFVLAFGGGIAAAQSSDAEQAYSALRDKDYVKAVAGFERALAAQPPPPADRAPAIHKDLAYTLLKIGENERARDQFAEAVRLDPADDHAALEYAFLCYETKQPAMARRVFARLRNSAHETADRATAAQAFQNIDTPLADAIARWQQALLLDPSNFSAHEELAGLAVQRDEFALAVEHYQSALRLKPQRTDLRLDLGRVFQQIGRDAEALAAWKEAAQSADARVAETARDLLPPAELASLPPSAPAAAPAARVTASAREMASKSLEKGYLQDAVKYLWVAHQTDPADFEVMLDMGRAYNFLRDDQQALKWFDQARRSPDARVAGLASKAYHNLAPALERFRTTVWAFPMFSSRWHDTFAYAQIKTELRVPHWVVHPYLSVRFIGDVRGATQSGASISPQNLSENSVILGAGVATNSWHGAMGWFEAGESLRYRDTAADVTARAARAVPDYRGGLSYAKGFGHLLSSGAHGPYAELGGDGVFVSRFSNDTIVYSQNRTGYTFAQAETFLGFHPQMYWNWNVATDVKRQYWANTVETGPGVRFRFEGLPAGMRFSVDAMRGVYLINEGNPRRPNFNDLRIGIWYAVTR
jgi:tetratricopeptide (TPR) repeat protein